MVTSPPSAVYAKSEAGLTCSPFRWNTHSDCATAIICCTSASSSFGKRKKYKSPESPIQRISKPCPFMLTSTAGMSLMVISCRRVLCGVVSPSISAVPSTMNDWMPSASLASVASQSAGSFIAITIWFWSVRREVVGGTSVSSLVW